MQAQIVTKAVILNHNLKKVLLIRRRSDDLDGWEGPGGCVEEGETLEESVMRQNASQYFRVGLQKILRSMGSMSWNGRFRRF